MPEVPVNVIAVLACGVASMIIGSLWYGPLFGKQWVALSGISMDKTPDGKSKKMGMAYGLMFVGSVVMAYVLAHSLIFAAAYLKVDGVSAGLMSGFWSWLGFVAPVTLSTVLWENKPWKLWGINNAYHLVTLCVMGIILAAWH